MKRAVLIVALLSLAGCSGQVPAAGETIEGEKFSGTFSRRTDGISGVVALTSDKGATCEGGWHLDQDHTGSVALTCSDGRTGTAELSPGAASGTMKGMLGGKRFEGTYEDPMRQAAR